MDSVEINCADPLLSSSHLSLLCSTIPMDSDSITVSDSLASVSNANSELLSHHDLQITMNAVDQVLAPPSPPWDDDDDVTMMMNSHGFKSFCNSTDMNEGIHSDDSSKVSSMVDEFLSYSPDSLR